MIRLVRLLLVAALMLAPLGRIGMAQAAAATPAAASGHCADTPSHTPASADEKGMAVDCMIACAALAAIPTPLPSPAPMATTPVPVVAFVTDPDGIRPDAELRPPRFS